MATAYDYASAYTPAAASAATSAGLIASGALTGAVAGPVGAAAGVVVGLAMSLFKGCGNACIEASKALQVYEVAANDIIAVAQSGMISGSTASSMVSSIMEAGLSQLANLQASGDKNAQGGIDILNQEMGGLVSQASSFGAATKTYSSSVAQSLMKDPSTPNWYSSSIIAGNNIAMGLLNSSISNITSNLFGSSSSLLLVAAIGLIILGIL